MGYWHFQLDVYCCIVEIQNWIYRLFIIIIAYEHTSAFFSLFQSQNVCVWNMPKHSLYITGTSHVLRKILFWTLFRYLFHPNSPYTFGLGRNWVKAASLPLNRQQHFNYISIWCDWYFLGVVDSKPFIHVTAKSQSQNSHHLVELCGCDDTKGKKTRSKMLSSNFGFVIACIQVMQSF